MEHSSIVNIFSQNKSLRQRIDTLQSQGYSPEEALSKAKLALQDTRPAKNRIRSLSLTRIKAERTSCPEKSAGSIAFCDQASKTCEFKAPLSYAAESLEANTRMIFKVMSPTTTSLDAVDFKWLASMAILNGIGAVTCSLALIYFGAKAGRFTLEAWFWALLFVISSSSLLLAIPLRMRSWKSWIQKVLGLAILVIGYFFMHTSIGDSEQRSIANSVSVSPAVVQLQAAITDLETRLDPTRKAIAEMDPVENRSTIAKMQRDSKPIEDELSRKRERLIEVQNNEKSKISNGLIASWSLVEWLRRLTLEPLNILCLHGLIDLLPELIKALRRRSICLAAGSV